MKWYVEMGEKRMWFSYRTLRFTYFTLKKKKGEFYRVLHDSGNNEEDIA